MLTKGADLDQGPASRARPSTSSMHGAHSVIRKSPSAIAAKVGPHRLPRHVEQRSELVVGELIDGLPWIDLELPQRLTPVDVADARAHALVEHHLADRGRAQRPRPLD